MGAILCIRRHFGNYYENSVDENCANSDGQLIDGLSNSSDSIANGRSPMLGLTQGELTIIKKVWTEIQSESFKLGERIFSRIFKTNPELKESFLFSELHTELLYLEPRFVKHANVFTLFLASIVEKLDESEEAVLDCARPIAVVHAKRARFDPLMFDPENWFCFLNAAVTEITALWYEKTQGGQRRFSANFLKLNSGGVSRTDVRSSWHLLLLRIVLEMKVGFYKELLRTARRPSRIMSIGAPSPRQSIQSYGPVSPKHSMRKEEGRFAKSKSSASFSKCYSIDNGYVNG